MAKYIRKCSVVGCNKAHRSLFLLPSPEEIRTQWILFIYSGNLPSTIPKIVYVCANHFTSDCFENEGPYNAGFASHLRLKPGSIPTLPAPQANVQAGAGTLQLKPDVAIQRRFRTVATQLSERRLIHRRSVGIQVNGVRAGTGETRPEEQSTTEKPPPSPPPDLSQPEIEDDNQCVTVESGETVSSESNGVADWPCPLCQKGQTDRSSLSLHLTEQHSVLPSCVDILLDIAVLKQGTSGREDDKGARKLPDAESPQLKHSEDLSSNPCQSSETSGSTQTLGDKEMEEARMNEQEGDEAELEPEEAGKQLAGTKLQNATENAEIPDASEKSVVDNGVPAENNLFKCNACLETFSSRTALSVHYNSASHIQRKNNQCTSVRYQCAICRVSYNHAITLENHMKSVLHQTRSRNAGIVAHAANTSSMLVGTTNAPNTVVSTSGSGISQLVTTANCAAAGTMMVTTAKDGDQIQTSQVAPSLLTSSMGSAQPVSALLTLLTSSPNTLSHSHLPSLFATGAAPGGTTPQLGTQPQMVMPLILNVQTQQHQENQQDQLLTQQHSEVGEKVSAQIKDEYKWTAENIKIENLEEGDDKEFLQFPYIESKVKAENNENNENAHRDSTDQQAVLIQRLNVLQNHWPSAGVPTNIQPSLEEQKHTIKCEDEETREDCEYTVGEKVSAQIKNEYKWTAENIKIENLEEDDKEFSHCPYIESKVKAENNEDSGNAHRDSTTDGDGSTDQLDLEGDKAASLDLSPAGTEKSLRNNVSPSAFVPSNSSLSSVNLNLKLSPDSTPQKSQTGTSPCGCLGTPKSSPSTNALTCNQMRPHCNTMGSIYPDLPVLSEFQTEVLWAFFESRSEADAASPPHEDCEALGKEVGLSEDEVRRWLSQARYAKQRQRATELEHFRGMAGFTRHNQILDSDYDDKESSFIIAKGNNKTTDLGSQLVDLSSTRGKRRHRDFGRDIHGDKRSIGGKVLRSTTVFLSDAEDEYEDEESGEGHSAMKKKHQGEFECGEVKTGEADLELEAQRNLPSTQSHSIDHPAANAVNSLPLSLTPFST